MLKIGDRCYIKHKGYKDIIVTLVCYNIYLKVWVVSGYGKGTLYVSPDILINVDEENE